MSMTSFKFNFKLKLESMFRSIARLLSPTKCTAQAYTTGRSTYNNSATLSACSAVNGHVLTEGSTFNVQFPSCFTPVPIPAMHSVLRGNLDLDGQRALSVCVLLCLSDVPSLKSLGAERGRCPLESDSDVSSLPSSSQV